MKILKKFCYVFCLLLILVNVLDVYAEEYSNVSLTKLNEIKDNQSLLDTVKNVTITYEDDLSLVDLLVNCKNIESLSINKATINDLTFINNIKPNNNFSLWISMGYYNMQGLANEYVNYLHLESSYISNFAKGMYFPNLKILSINYIDGYEDIDYSIYKSMESLTLNCISISDYQTFFGQLNELIKLDSLGLVNCNITDDDTKYLKENKYIKDLSLEDCYISDISFLEEMTQIEGFHPPANVEDLSVIKKMSNLKYVYWTGYEQLALTDDLVNYLDENNISHNKYDSTLKNTLLNMVNTIDVDDKMAIKEKIEKVVDYVTNFVKSHNTSYNEEYSSNSLLYIVHFKTGVCSNYSHLEHALLKLMGIDSYYIGGLHPIYMREQLGDFSTEYVDDLEYQLAGHAWLMAKDENGVWHGWDPVQIDIYIGLEGAEDFWIDNVYGKKINFWKNPYEDDNYTYQQFMDGEYDTFNFYFAKRHVVTNKLGYEDYLKQKSEIKLIDILKNKGFNVTSNLVLGFSIGKNISDIKKQLNDNDIVISTENLMISTGAVIKKGNESYAVVIKGDLNGDGKVNSADLLQMRKYLLEEVNLTGAYKEAGIIESNGEIKSLDLLRLRQYLLDEYVFK